MASLLQESPLVELATVTAVFVPSAAPHGDSGRVVDGNPGVGDRGGRHTSASLEDEEIEEETDVGDAIVWPLVSIPGDDDSIQIFNSSLGNLPETKTLRTSSAF